VFLNKNLNLENLKIFENLEICAEKRDEERTRVRT